MKKLKTIPLFILSLCLVFLTGCSNKGKIYFDFFDTVSYIYSYAGDTQGKFDKRCEETANILSEYNRLFDIYHEYSEMNNLKTVNDLAVTGEWVQVDDKLITFLKYAEELYYKTNGEMNVMMGSVLKLWHECRENANARPPVKPVSIPTQEQLEEANKHTSFSALEIDEENGCVRITDPEASIDVGALGKGYATEQAAQYLKSIGVKGYVLNIGGNIRAIGAKKDGTGWATGITDPADKDYYAKKITIADTSCVTSGDYERFFTVDGKRYHHIIDKDTLMPAEYFSSITVITPNSGLADALSTALFCMSHEEGLKLLENFENVEVLWITPDGTQYQTEGFAALGIE